MTDSAVWEVKKDQGNAAFKSGRYEEAVSLYGEAIEDNDKEAALFSNRSAAYLKLGRHVEAARDAEKATEVDPSFLKAYPRLHIALCNLGKFSDAYRALGRAIEYTRANNPILQEDIKNLFELQKQADDAMKALETARRFLNENCPQQAESALVNTYRQFPDCAQIAFLFAEARVSREPDEVSNSMQSFSRTHDSDPQYLYVRALCTYYRGLDGFPQAQKILRHVLEHDPDNSASRILLKKIRAVEQSKESGNTAFREKRFADALKHYSDAIDIDGTNKRMNATLRGNRSATKLELRDFQGALLDCEFAINHGNDAPKMYARRSRIFEAMEKMDDALRDLQQAAERDESYAQDLHQLKIRVKRSKRKDYYKILGVDQHSATEESLKRAYKKAALQWHPDKWAHSSDEEKRIAEEKFKEVGEALAVLSDPRKKRMYDNGQLDDNVEGSGGGGGFGGGQEDMMQMFNMMFGGGGMGMHGMGGGRRQQGFPPGFSFQ